LVRAGTWVFVVEDETIQAMELDDMLARLGCRVAGNAASLRDALDKARRLEFDLAIVDLKLGSHSGEAVVDEVARRRIPLIITSGYDLRASGKHSGHMLLPKPFTLEELRLAISFALGEGAQPEDRAGR